eukprot:3276666-Rhodomonas_salina.1
MHMLSATTFWCETVRSSEYAIARPSSGSRMAPSRSPSNVPCSEDANMNLALDRRTSDSAPARLITIVAIWSTTQAVAALLTADCTDAV